MHDDINRWAGPLVPPSVEELADRYALGQLVKVYALGADMRDYDLMRSVFADDAFGQGSTKSAPIDEYLPFVFKGASAYQATQHNITNQHISIVGDEAVVWSYAIAIHKAEIGGDKPHLNIGVQYRDKCRRTSKGWLITHRQVVVQWSERFEAKADS
ncbi:nuclear transport factor 2 family protein [Novosphingobium pentaromativorans]|uniref:SnoaL-like domain-containing protein n=1 Tax=Novosphingobium pentaromativorans US6-1 TaxID=1088721 RepID=G6EGD7_9SPHN|nr:nuclear transport factor 2 family protein [Novosphingobium pentaromativorans]EHJ59826.1 hypothetical protein NSU_3408 [Novosphingobium pentaromativorans US6-1]